MEETAIRGVPEIARGISEFGMLAISAGSYIVFTLIMMIFFLRTFTKMINKTVNTQQEKLDNIIKSQEEQNVKISQVKEALTGEIFNQIRVLMSYVLESNRHSICTTIIGEIKEKKSGENKPATEKKVKTILENLYRKMKVDIDAFQYNGKRLSEYCSDEWIKLVHDFCIESIYDGKEYHRDPYLNGLDIIFNSIKIEFFDNLKRMK